MNKSLQLLIIMLWFLGISFHSVAQGSSAHLVKPINIQNFGEANLNKLRHKIANVEAKVAPPDSVLRIIQLGDSHTAADIFTGQLRDDLQQRYGSAGIGWISPINVYGQRNKLVYYTNTDWLLTSSRSTPATDYPLGGFIATPASANARLTINYNLEEKPSLWNVTFLVKQQKTGKPLKIIDGMNFEITLDTGNNKQWQYVSHYLMLPFTIVADSADSAKLGGIWLEKNGAPGITVSPIALNGAKQSIWTQWRADWMKDLTKTNSDLVILAYGTNESLETPFNLVKYKQFLTTSIKQIRSRLPHSVILIISPPDALLRSKLTTRNCQAMQPPQAKQIRQAQLAIAKQQHTLYWDWQAAMGGECAMRRWVDAGLANKDYIHLTALGYQQSADSFYKALLELLNGAKD